MSRFYRNIWWWLMVVDYGYYFAYLNKQVLGKLFMKHCLTKTAIYLVSQHPIPKNIKKRKG